MDGIERTLVLIGFVGSGKSATGNTILEKDCFETSIAQFPLTTDLKSAKKTIGTLNLTVVDTPGIDDPKQICQLNQGDNCIYALVIRIGRISDEQRSVIQGIFQNKKIFKNVFIIFTNTNELIKSKDESTQTVDGWLKKVPTLENIIKKNGVPYVAFENENPSKVQQKKQIGELCEILNNIDKMRPAQKRCPVSQQNEEFIYVSREMVSHEFGSRGRQFFEEQLRKQTQQFNEVAGYPEHNAFSFSSGSRSLPSPPGKMPKK